VLVGGDFLNFDHPFIKFENSTLVKEVVEAATFENMHVLIKGSRSMQMEKILEE
jgi:UDP-N-acetylmuramoyl-tripeptide--D-alanyl-D-alanine ligase